ncbi:MAG: AMP-binding protein [Erysipelotrichaceae bacterium]|jgi:acyl carrier protein|nr:AMP-binding protein [Erysipelotrichaceae bacterium]
MKKRNKRAIDYININLGLLSQDQTYRGIYQTMVSNDGSGTIFIERDLNGKDTATTYRAFEKRMEVLLPKIKVVLEAYPINKPVGLKYSNSGDFIYLLWAIVLNGYTPILIDARASKDITNNLLITTKCSLLFTNAKDTYKVASYSLSDVEKIANANVAYSYVPGASILFVTSGTTGTPKLIVHDEASIVQQVFAAKKMGEFSADIVFPRKTGDLRILASLPFHHIFGFVAIMLWFTFYGKTIIFPAQFQPKDLVGACKELKVTHVFSVPLFWDSVVQTLNRTLDLEKPVKKQLVNNIIKYNLGKISLLKANIAAFKPITKKVQASILGTHLRFCISGGGYLSSNTLETINGLGYPLHNGFGMTECGITSVDFSNTIAGRCLNSIGRPFYGTEYRIKNPNAEGIGELLVKSTYLHSGEIINNVNTAVPLDQDGFFATGDMAMMDQHGNYFIKGRIKEIIIKENGENVYPDEVEAFYKDIKDITRLSVLGISYLPNTEEIVLVINQKKDLTNEEFEVLKTSIFSVTNKLPLHLKPNRVLFTNIEIPLSSSLKVRRNELRKLILAMPNEYISADENTTTSDLVVILPEDEEKYIKPLKIIFSKILILPPEKITNTGHFITDFGGDSLSYIQLISDVEETFNISISDNMIGQLTNVIDFYREVKYSLTKK